MATEFRVLGPVSVRIDEQAVPLGPRQQAVLVVLLVEPNRLVSRDQLLDRVWGEKLPARPLNAMQTQLTLLRRALAASQDVTITWQTGGYRLAVDEDTIDLHRFRRLVGQARRRSTEDAAALLGEALELWRGEPFVGIDVPWFAKVRANLLAEQHAATLDRTDALLSLGWPEAVLPALTVQAQTNPLDERLSGQLMRALHKAGRTADALRHYEKVRTRLVEDLGADPSPPLRQLHQELLGANPVGPAPAPPQAASTIPRQLPAAPASFTGRAQELAALTRILDTATEAGDPVVISATSGTGGIGKTWLTLYWAHQQRHRFPDGQLFVDLRGFSPEGRPMPTETAIRGLLDALGVPDTQIPTSLDAQTALWRTLLTGKRMLIVLDNAADSEQVLPLLPGGTTNTVIVSSRDHLIGLVNGYGAYRLNLDILSEAEARDVLRARIGPDRLAAEPAAVDKLLALCGGFPLALSIVAGQAQNYPDFPLATLAAELEEGRLAALDDEDPSASLPSVLSWSYATLTKEQARVFGLLGIAPGPDISLPAAAALIGNSAQDTRTLLRALVRTSLLREDFPGRYTMHDLVRAYAQHTADAEAEPALHRVVEFYLRTGYAGELVINPIRQPIPAPAASADVRPGTFDGVDEVMTWFTEEYLNIVAVQHQITVREWDTANWQLSWALGTFRWRTGRHLDEVASWRTSLVSVLRLGDRGLEALAKQMLGNACTRAEAFDEAEALLTESIRIAAEIGDPATEGFSERGLARVYTVLEKHPEALAHNERALVLFEKVGNQAWIDGELNNIGWGAAHLGDYEYAKSCCEKALDTSLRIRPDDHSGIGLILDSLGFIAEQMGRLDDAISYYEQAKARFGINNDRYFAAATYEHIGYPYRALGRLADAREAWQVALRIYRDQQRSVDVERVRDALEGLSDSAGP
ncbi:MAG TPA: BTAD domain-containing putative transcriptional regulator [Pseudonocardiaceae bacterium]|nr:BTAD domain-containing putative transcriptional regulator [Pseudonocardiaceae bacterium]